MKPLEGSVSILQPFEVPSSIRVIGTLFEPQIRSVMFGSGVAGVAECIELSTELFGLRVKPCLAVELLVAIATAPLPRLPYVDGYGVDG